MKAIKSFTSSRLGHVSKGDPIPDDAYGRHLVEVGLAEPTYKTKVVRETPDKPRRKKASKK